MADETSHAEAIIALGRILARTALTEGSSPLVMLSGAAYAVGMLERALTEKFGHPPPDALAEYLEAMQRLGRENVQAKIDQRETPLG